MALRGKYIGIDKWVPFVVLDEGMALFLEQGNVDREHLKQHLREYIRGENRVSKAAKVASDILTRSAEILEACKNDLTKEAYVHLPVSERKALMIALFAVAFPIFYDLMVAMAMALKVQPEINKRFISQRMSALYGSNRTVDMALDSLVIMIVELGVVKRNKISIYSLSEPKTIRTPVIGEAYIYADIKMSGSKTILLEDIAYRPWYLYYEVAYNAGTHTRLLQYVEGRIGGGYIGIR